MPRLGPPRPHCPQALSEGDTVAWGGLGAPSSNGKLKARPVALGCSRWAQELGGPTGHISAATRKILCPHRQGWMEGCGASACSPAQPHLHSGGAAPVTSASVTRCICWDTACAQGRGASPQHLPPMGRASWIWANQTPRSSMSSFPGESAVGTVLGWAGRAAQEAAGVRPNQPCSLTGLGRAQERLKSLKPDSYPRLATLGPLSGHLCSIFFAVSKPRNLSFKLKLSPDYRCWDFERWS